jgi:hypothetical protein
LAEVTGYLNATATALSGAVLGDVHALQGNATVTARTEVTGRVTAGRDARVWVLGPITSPEITAERDAYVTSYAAISSPVTTTGGDAYVSAGTSLSANVTGQQSAYAQARTGNLSGNVTANVSDASASAGGEVSGTVTGQRHAMAGALGSVNGNVTATAGHASAVARGGQVTGKVTAGQSAGAFALGNITGNVYAGRDAISATLGSSIGSVTAGRDALAVAGNAVSGPVTGGRHAGILAFGPVSAGVNAASGDAFVVTWGTVGNTVSAGDSAFVAAGDGGSVTVNAATDAAVVSFRPIMAFVQAGRDGYAWSAGTLTGNLQTARDGAVISLAAANMGLATGRDAYAWTFDEYHSNIFAGRDALIVSLGAVNGGIFAGGSGLIYAVEDTIGSVTAGEYAGVVTWGTAAGPMSVKGPDGAFGWSYGDFNGFVESSDGSAFLTTYGNGVGAVRGADYAAAYVVGDWVGDIEAGDDAGGIALGSFTGNLTAGASGYAISEGDVSASLSAARDALVWAIGDITGTYDAGRDAAAVAYGDFDADISADRDVVTVWARGNLTGTIEAGRNVGLFGAGLPTSPGYPVFSYGQISADIDALNPAGLTGGGHIGSVAAWGSIGGQFEAADTIHEVRSGDAVSATLIAPNVPVPIEFDATILTQYALPTTPESVAGQVMAQATSDYAAVLATKAQVATQITGLLAEFAAEKAAEAVRLADTIAQATASVAAAHAEAEDALGIETAEATAQLDTGVAAAQGGLASLRTAIDASKAAIEEARNRVGLMRNNAYTQAARLVTVVSAAMVEADATMSESSNMVTSNSNAQKAARQAKWEDIRKFLASSVQAGWYHLPPPPDPPRGSSSAHFTYSRFALTAVMKDLGLPEYQMAADRTLWGMDAANDGVEALGYSCPPGMLLLALSKLYRGKDLLDRELTTGQRIWAGVDVAAVLAGPLLETVRDLAGFAKKADDVVDAAEDASRLGRQAGNACFVAGTEVHCPSEPNRAWLAAGAGVLLAGAGLLVVTRRKGRDQDAERVDEVFGTEPGGDCPIDHETLDELGEEPHEPSRQYDGFFDFCESDNGLPWASGDGRCDTGSADGRDNWFAGYSPSSAGDQAVATIPRRDTLRCPAAVCQPLTKRSSSFSQASTGVQTQPIGSRPSAVRRIGLAGFLVSLLLAAFCAYRGSAPNETTTKPIDEMEIFDRVVGKNPLACDTDRSLPEPDPADSRLLRLRLETEDDLIDIDLARPGSWLRAAGAATHGKLRLDMPELGAVGEAEVLSVGPCPPPARGHGPLVTGVFRHHAKQVIDLYVEGADEPIGCTPNHPFWSEDRQEFVPAGQLRPNERLRTSTGDTPRITAIGARAGKEPVYNIEVNGEHVYQVGPLAVLVHNKAMKAPDAATEIVQRWMSRAELEATRETGLVRGGRQGTHFVTDAANASAERARQRLALPQTPEVRVTMRVPADRFGPPTRVKPDFGMPGGGMERTAIGEVPVEIINVEVSR